MLAILFLLLATTGISGAQNVPPLLKNPSFDSRVSSTGQIPGWDVSVEAGSNGVRVRPDTVQVKQGSQSLSIKAKQPISVKVSQEIFLPVGSTWKVSAWVKGEALDSKGVFRHNHNGLSRAVAVRDSGTFELETPVGIHAEAPLPLGTFPWRREELSFRVPSPGRVRIALLTNASGQLWADDIHLEPLILDQTAEVHIVNSKIGKLPIDVKQGGQFIEPLCHLIPSMLAQQVESGSFEQSSPCIPSYKGAADWPNRPWYPDGAVHDASFSLDTTNPYNGKQSEKIEMHEARARAGISQDGFYLTEGQGYRLHLYMRGIGQPPVWASLRSPDGLIAGPVMIGHAGDNWQSAGVVLRANRTTRNATLTIESEGPGTLWLDRISLIGDDAVLGLWRPDVVAALKAMDPGIIRFGGTMIKRYEWDESIGPSDKRIPYVTFPWGGLDPNFVGIEEFTQLARYVGAEPLICVRWEGKKPEDAAAEVEYMNGGVQTHWGRIRAQNGHPEPYRVKYWQIGNEIGGSQYDDSIKAFAEAMHRVDPSIKILSSFPSAETLNKGGGYIDYICPHHYQVGDIRLDEADFDTLRDQIAKYDSGKTVRVAVTEWNTTAGEMGLGRGMLLTLGNALSASRYQNMLHRFADLVEIAVRSNLSDSFGSGVIQPGLGWLYLAPTYYSQKLYQRAAGTYPLRLERSSHVPRQLEDPDLSATLSPDGKLLRIYAVNSTAKPEKVKFHLDGFASSAAGGEIIVLKDKENALDSEAMNTRYDPRRVATVSHATDVKGKEFHVSIEPFSVTLLELKLVPARSGK